MSLNYWPPYRLSRSFPFIALFHRMRLVLLLFLCSVLAEAVAFKSDTPSLFSSPDATRIDLCSWWSFQHLQSCGTLASFHQISLQNTLYQFQPLFRGQWRRSCSSAYSSAKPGCVLCVNRLFSLLLASHPCRHL